MIPTEADRAISQIAAALARNSSIAILPSVKPESVQLAHRDGEQGTFSATEVARVLAENGDLEAYFVGKF